MPVIDYQAQGAVWVPLIGGSSIDPSPPDTQFSILGSATDPMSQAGVTALETAVGGVLGCRRTYDFTANFFPTTFAGSAANSDQGKRVSVYSAVPNMANLTSGALDGQITSFLASIPTGHKTYLTVYHEFDDKIHKGTYTLAAWRAAFTHFCDLVHAAGRPELKTYLCPTTSWWDWGIAPSPATYWPGDDLNGYVDVLGGDSYNNYAPGNASHPWKTPQTILGPMIQLAASKGVPWGVGETGSEEDPADPTRKAQWIGQLADLMDDPNCEYVCYFNLAGTTGTSQRLLTSSQNSLAAFKAALLRHPIPTGVTV